MQVIASMGTIQQKLIETDPLLQHCCLEPMTAHITIMVLYLPTQVNNTAYLQSAATRVLLVICAKALLLILAPQLCWCLRVGFRATTELLLLLLFTGAA